MKKSLLAIAALIFSLLTTPAATPINGYLQSDLNGNGKNINNVNKGNFNAVVVTGISNATIYVTNIVSGSVTNTILVISGASLDGSQILGGALTNAYPNATLEMPFTLTYRNLDFPGIFQILESDDQQIDHFLITNSFPYDLFFGLNSGFYSFQVNGQPVLELFSGQIINYQNAIFDNTIFVGSSQWATDTFLIQDIVKSHRAIDYAQGSGFDLNGDNGAKISLYGTPSLTNFTYAGNGGWLTNVDTIGTKLGLVTNNGLVWLSTNTPSGTLPSIALPNGSIFSSSSGQFGVRSNGAWILH